MTRDELDAAKNDVLDAEAAKVMGWVRRTNGEVGGYAGPDAPEHEQEYDRRLCEYWWEKQPDGSWKSRGNADGNYEERAWSPSTSIADAWELVEKLIESEPALRRRFGEWICQFEAPHVGWVEASHKSAPRAITTAALLAWGEKEKA